MGEKDPARNVQEEEGDLNAGVCTWLAMLEFNNEWSSLSLFLSISMTLTGTFLYVRYCLFLILIGSLK